MLGNINGRPWAVVESLFNWTRGMKQSRFLFGASIGQDVRAPAGVIFFSQNRRRKRSKEFS